MSENIDSRLQSGLFLKTKNSLSSLKSQKIIVSVVLFAQIFICVTGSIVRVTASGLGCSTWPQCFPGSYTPNKREEVPVFHQIIEFTNRQIAVWLVTGSAVLILLAVYAAKRSNLVKKYAWCMPLGTVLQAILGGITVLSGLKWWTVSLHMLASLVMVWLASILLVLIWVEDETKIINPISSIKILIFPILATVATVILGTLTTGAGPYSGDISISHPVERLQVPIKLLLSIHATLAAIIVLSMIFCWVRINKDFSFADKLYRYSIYVLVFQVFIGITQTVMKLPKVLVSIHVFGATFFICILTITFTVIRIGKDPFKKV